MSPTAWPGLLVPCEGQMPRNALVSSEQSVLDATLLSRSFSKMLTTGRALLCTLNSGFLVALVAV